MSQQEIGIKLRLDTSNAVKSVKDLERTMQGLENIEAKGKNNNLLLSEEDVKHFERLSRRAQQVWQEYSRNYSRIQTDFVRKKRELDEAIKRGAGQSSVDALQREVNQLLATRNMLKGSMPTAHQYAQQAYNSSQSIGGMNQVNPTLLNMSKGAIGMLTSMFAFNKIYGSFREGMGMVKSQEDYAMGLGQRMDSYRGDYRSLRHDAEATGVRNGYGGQATLDLASVYTNIAGVRSKEATWKDIQGIQTGARALGIDPNSLASTGGNLNRLGAVKDGEQKKFAELLADAIKKGGMQGRDSEFVEAVNQLTDVTARGQLQISGGQLNGIVGLQSLLSKEAGFKGQRGADVLSSIDAGIKGGDNRVDLMLGWGTELQGIHGRAELARRKGKGLSDPENVKRIFSGIGKTGDKDYQMLMLSDMFGLSPQQADRLLQPDMIDKLKTGDYSIGKDGSAELARRSGEVNGSDAMTRAKTDANVDNSKKWWGEKGRDIIDPIMSSFSDQHPLVQGVEMLTGAWGLGKGAKWAGSKILPSLFSSPITKSAGGGLTRGLLSGASKIWKPLAIASMLMEGGDIVGGWGKNAGDSFFGTSKLEKEIVEKRDAILDKQMAVLGQEKKNIDDMTKLAGGNSPNSVSSGNTSGGFWGGVKRFFGFGGGESSGGATSLRLKSGNEFLDRSLRGGGGVSASDLDSWINANAPEGSLMRGKGATFLKASQESGLDPRYLVAHAALESGWGTSNIATQKGNMFGIGAFDKSPMASAFKFGGADAGIIEGAKWIAKNYTDNGQDTLYQMRHNGGEHEYSTDPLWDQKIASIMSGAPNGRQQLDVVVSGGVDGLTPENNSAVTQALKRKFTDIPNLAFEFRQGIGGNR